MPKRALWSPSMRCTCRTWHLELTDPSSERTAGLIWTAIRPSFPSLKPTDSSWARVRAHCSTRQARLSHVR